MGACVFSPGEAATACAARLRRVVALLWAGLVLARCSTPGGESAGNGPQLRAAYLINFIRGMSNGPVAGDDDLPLRSRPSSAHLARHEGVACGRSGRIRRVRFGSTRWPMSGALRGGVRPRRQAALIATVARLPVLTVAETAAFVRCGARSPCCARTTGSSSMSGWRSSRGPACASAHRCCGSPGCRGRAMSRRFLPARLRGLIRRLPIHRKLSVIVAIAVATSLVFVFVIVGWCSCRSSTPPAGRQAAGGGRGGGLQRSAVLEFQDPVGAEHLFRALEAIPAIVAAHLVAARQHLPPHLSGKGGWPALLPRCHAAPRELASYLGASTLAVVVPMYRGGELIGSLSSSAASTCGARCWCCSSACSRWPWAGLPCSPRPSPAGCRAA